jgi:hypothetical protein
VTRRIWAVAICALAAAALVAAGPAGADTVDPDQSAKVSSDVNLSLRVIDSGVYELTVQNQSGLGSINRFAWVPGPGWTVTAIVATSYGKCIVNNGAMSCNGKISAPTRCTCLPGGKMTIRFRMNGPPAPPPSKQNGTVIVGTAGGFLVVKTITLVHRHIPSALPSGL